MAINKLPKLYNTDFRLPNKKPVGDVEIDWGNPLIKDAVDYYPILSKDVGGRERNYLSTFSGVFEANIVRGPEYIENTSTASSGFSTPERSFSSDFTIAFKAQKIDTANINRGVILGKGTTDRLWLYLDDQFYFTISGTSVSWTGLPNFRTANRTYVLQRIGSSIELFVDGVSYGARTNAGTFFYNRFFNPYPAFTYKGTLSYFYAVDRAIPTGGVQSFLSSLYQILKPKSEPVYFTADTGGTTITVIESLNNSNYAPLNPSISLTGSISITESLVNANYTALNPTISFVGIISISESLVNANYTALNPDIDFTGLVSVTESPVNSNYSALNSTVTLTSGAVEIIESAASTQYAVFNPSILLTPEPLGIVSTVCFSGVLADLDYSGQSGALEFNGQLETAIFNGEFNTLYFSGTIQTTCADGDIKTNC